MASSPKTVDLSTVSPQPANPPAGHTPGPWFLEHCPDGSYYAIKNRPEWGSGHIWIASAEESHLPKSDGFPSDEQGLANAQLIAAAPELLAACRRAKKLLEPEVTKEPDRTIFWELVSAIAKAEGRQ